MKLGELFFDLGVEGSEKTVGAVTGVRSGLKETASVGLETKAAILGAMYAVQQLFSTSNRAGNDLKNFNSLLGVSAQTLQQYQYAARQVGVSNSEMEGTFKGLQSTLTRTLMGEGAPKGLARVSMLTGGMTADDLKKFAEQPQLLIQKLQEYAQKETNAGLRNEVLKSFGVGEGVAAAMKRNAFRPEILSQAPTYSDNEIASLDKANAAWSNLGNKIEMAVGKFNAKHGGELVKDISIITDKVLKLAEAFVKLAEKLKFFELIGKVFQGWAMIFDTINEAVDEAAAQDQKKGVKGSTSENFIERLMPKKVGEPRSIGEETQNVLDFFRGGGMSKLFNGEPLVSPKAIAPGMPAVQGGASNTTTQNVNVNQTMNFPGAGTDPAKTADATRQAVKQAFRQMPAQSQGN